MIKKKWVLKFKLLFRIGIRCNTKFIPYWLYQQRVFNIGWGSRRMSQIIWKLGIHFLLTGNQRKVLKLHIWIPIKSDCIGVTFVPPTYPFDQNTDLDFQKQSGYHLRKGPSLEDSVHSEITYLRKITPRVTMTKSTYFSSERTVS